MTWSSERDWLPICARVCSRLGITFVQFTRPAQAISLYDEMKAPADGGAACRRHDLTSKAGAFGFASAVLLQIVCADM